MAHREVSLEEGRAIFDRAARTMLNMSGDEFVAAYNAGVFDEDPDQPAVVHLLMLAPFHGHLEI
jgi:hypothetical protein